jgi:hypothetical protein
MMRMSNIIRCLGLACGLLGSVGTTSVLAQEPVDCKFAKDGKFNSREEYRVYQLHQVSDEYKFFDTNCDGAIQRSERKAYEDFLQDKIRQKLRDFDRQAGVGLPTQAPKPKAMDPFGDCSLRPGWRSCLIVRDSFEDISIFSQPKDAKLASGAQFSWAQDSIAANAVWSAKGVVAYPIAWTTDQNPAPRSFIDPYLVGFALTPSMTINRVSNSNAALAKKNVDVLTYNAGSEFAVGHLFDATTTHYFRGRLGLQSDSTGVTQSRAVTLEYQPITTWETVPNLSSPNSLFFLPVTYEVDPILRYQYLAASDATDLPLFMRRRHISRIGPVIALSIIPEQGETSPVPEWLQRVNFNLTYNWLKDLDTGTTYKYFFTSLGFALDPAGHFAIKISYETGQVEETGQDVRITKVGLAAKF